MTTTHRTHLVLWAVFAALVGVMSLLFARGASICFVGEDLTLAERSPWVWWAFALLAAFAGGLALAMAGLARIRSDHAACPHCGKEVEPRVSMLGELKFVAPPASRSPPAAP